jgi:hypothetical protein
VARGGKVKSIKRLGLAGLMALAMMVAFGTASATAGATTLCLGKPGTDRAGACRADQLLTHVHETSAGKARLLTGALDVECDALFLGDATSSSTGPGSALVLEGAFTYDRCTAGCIVTEESLPVEIAVLKLGHEARYLHGYSLVHVNCEGISNCTYKSRSMRGTGRDASLSDQPNGEVVLQEQTTNKESGLLCLDFAKLDLVTTPLNPVYTSS